MPDLRTRLRERRVGGGLSQQALAQRAGVARQTVSGLEAGLYGPSVEVALRLARALGCRVEDLFALEEAAEAEPVGRIGAVPARVALASIGGRAVARTLDGLGALGWPTAAAHGLAEMGGAAGTVSVRRFGGAAPAVFLCGCDPALGLLAAHTARAGGGVEALWWQAGNAEALAQLRRGEVHAAALHGDGAAREGQAVAAEGGSAAGLAGFRLGRWRMGWLVRAGNPLGIRGPEDLARPGIRLANREPGAGARDLLDRLLAGARVDAAAIAGYGEHLPGHGPVADAVAGGRADVGIGPEVAAQARGLAFLPLAAEVCDVWLPRETLEDAGVAALLATLGSGAFRADLSAFGPYDTRETGDRLA